MEEYRKAFSKNLLYYMKKQGLSGVEIAKIAGVSKQAVSAWLNGIKIPRMDKIELLARYFGILKSDLLEEHDREAERQRIIETAKIALFDGGGEVTDAMWEEVLNFAKFVEAREAAKKDDDT